MFYQASINPGIFSSSGTTSGNSPGTSGLTHSFFFISHAETACDSLRSSGTRAILLEGDQIRMVDSSGNERTGFLWDLPTPFHRVRLGIDVLPRSVLSQIESTFDHGGNQQAQAFDVYPFWMTPFLGRASLHVVAMASLLFCTPWQLPIPALNLGHLLKISVAISP